MYIYVYYCKESEYFLISCTKINVHLCILLQGECIFFNIMHHNKCTFMYIMARGVYIFYIMHQNKCTFMYIIVKGVYIFYIMH